MKNQRNETLIQKRKTKNLSITDVASQVGITSVGYSNYERHGRIPNVVIGTKIADVLGVTDLRELWPQDDSQDSQNACNDKV